MMLHDTSGLHFGPLLCSCIWQGSTDEDKHSQSFPQEGEMEMLETILFIVWVKFSDAAIE
jgi:hypothetical protein